MKRTLSLLSKHSCSSISIVSICDFSLDSFSPFCLSVGGWKRNVLINNSTTQAEPKLRMLICAVDTSLCYKMQAEVYNPINSYVPMSS